MVCVGNGGEAAWWESVGVRRKGGWVEQQRKEGLVSIVAGFCSVSGETREGQHLSSCLPGPV